MSPNQKRAINRLRIFLNWCYDGDQDERGLVKIARKDFAFFAEQFDDDVVKNYMQSTSSFDVDKEDDQGVKLALMFSIKFAESLYQKYS